MDLIVVMPQTEPLLVKKRNCSVYKTPWIFLNISRAITQSKKVDQLQNKLQKEIFELYNGLTPKTVKKQCHD